MASSRRLARAAILTAAAAALVVGAVVGTGTWGGEGDDTSRTPPSDDAGTDGAGVADAGPTFPLVDAEVGEVVIAPGDDWTLPEWALPADDSGFYSTQADPETGVDLHAVDVSWAQIAPEEDAPLDLEGSGAAQDMDLEPLAEQLAEPGPYWLRLFATGTDWAPSWVAESCGVSAVGFDEHGQGHLPIWNACVWEALRDTWRRLLVDTGVLDDPDFRFAYVPGGFTWAEFNLDMVGEAAEEGQVDEAEFLSWFDTMLEDFADIAGDRVGRLVYTGEDYPRGPFGEADDLLAAKAVGAGFGVRTGITEVSNFHLSETPAYGSSIQPDGHLAIDPPPPVGTAGRVVATENECYQTCGFTTLDPDYTVVASNLKALQLRMNWMYVEPTQSRFRELPEHWDWVRLSLGQVAATSPDAWTALRDAEDTFWEDPDAPGPFVSDGRAWTGRPYVRNLERFLVQQDVAPAAVPVRSEADIHADELTPANGTAYEGLRTDLASGSDSFAFDLDDDFAAEPFDALVKIVYLDAGTGGFTVLTEEGVSPVVEREDTGEWRTATVRVSGMSTYGAMHGGTDLWITASGDDLDVRFVRVLRREPPG